VWRTTRNLLALATGGVSTLIAVHLPGFLFASPAAPGSCSASHSATASPTPTPGTAVPWNSLAYVSPWTGWVVLSASDMVKGNFLLRTTDAGRTWLKIAF